MCLKCIQSRQITTSATYTKPTNQVCKYTLQELLNLAKTHKNGYLTSQINIYKHDCNRYNKYIDALI